MRKKAFRFLFRFLLLVLFITGAIFTISWFRIKPVPVTKPGKDLRILSMNVTADNVIDPALQSAIATSNSDFIVVIEWTGDNLNLDLFRQKGYKVLINHPRKKVHGICVLGKHEGAISIIEAPVKTPCTLPVGQVRFSWEGKPVCLFAVHAPPPVAACEGTNSDYIKAMSEWVENGQLCKDVGIAQKGDRVIFAGDFNCFSFERAISDLKAKGLVSNSGFFNQTWKPFKTFPYIAQIDYILASDNFLMTNHSRFSIPGSDHLGIVADLQLK